MKFLLRRGGDLGIALAFSIGPAVFAFLKTAALLIKESVNQTQDNQGFYNSLNACFTLHQLNHSHWVGVHGGGFPVANEADGVPSWREAPPVVLSVKDKVRGDV